MKKFAFLSCMVLSISASAFTQQENEDFLKNSEVFVNNFNPSDSKEYDAHKQLFEDCKMTIRDNQTGKSYTITVHGTSCADLIKAMIK